MKFKTLVFKEGTKYQEFLHLYRALDGEWYTSAIPELKPIEATMELIEKLHPNLDFNNVTLVTIEVKIIEK